MTASMSNLFLFVDRPEEADFLFHPADRDYFTESNRYWTFELLRMGGALKKPLLVFNNEDQGVPLDGFFNIMHSGHRDWRFNGIASPGWSPLTPDLRRIPLPITLRKKPRIVFCGSSHTAEIRRQAVAALKATKLDKEVIERPKYFYCMFEPNSMAEREGKIDFLRTMAECDYNFCVRGYANTAYRMFETLCAGRIPVVVDTGTLLPRPELEEWGLCCTVTDLNAIERTVLDHWQTVDLDYFARCRQFWAEYLSVPAWFRWLHTILARRCQNPNAGDETAPEARR
jgi:hypothetical protein